ncbi:glycosyltransferase [Carboxydothermus ferrireducens]|uniref:Glycosyltransferase involved in cell wall biosynthesis n=1 Tax=Carboxydothermus ferrireducens DSM 11255 TaxID=1119529 RepID=A0ABX2RD98_9THEO|nr:glycosyltransferase [Carboxydothermus ferrireducens]NYE58033.1 glycosyltransferase involved in cell wall biosynthesis [Carboxydothermus ferrireducens DSM 11255]
MQELLLLHGYFLSGSGSNLLVRNLASNFAEKDLKTVLVCQERNPEKYSFIRDAIIVEPDTGKLVPYYHNPGGKVILYNPKTSILPVFVYDDYPGFKVKTFTELSIEELERYINEMVTSLKIISANHNIQFVFAQHLIINPYIVKQLGIPYSITVHGSDISYTIERDERYHFYALEGIKGAYKVITLSNELTRRLKPYLDFPEKITEITPGVDGKLFGELAAVNLLQIKGNGRSKETEESFYHGLSQVRSLNELLKYIDFIRKNYDYSLTDQHAGEKLNKVSRGRNLILFLGKHLYAKGPQLLALALPYLLEEKVNAAFVGHGLYREVVEALVYFLRENREDLVAEILNYGEEGYPNPGKMFYEELTKSEKEQYLKLARQNLTGDRVVFTGQIFHPELAAVIQRAKLLVVPSLVKEAFGMVAVEGIAAGALPLVDGEGGMASIITNYTAFLKKKGFNLSLDTFILSKLRTAEGVREIVDKGKRLLELYEKLGEEQIWNLNREFIHSYYDWSRIAQKYRELSQNYWQENPKIC